MRKLSLVHLAAILLSFAIVACSHHSKRVMASEKEKEVVVPTLESLLNPAPAAPEEEIQKTSLSKVETQALIERARNFCEKNSDFCSVPRTRTTRDPVVRIKLTSPSQMANLTVNQSLRLLERMKAQERLKLAEQYSEHPGCEHVESRYALALIMERNLPDQQYFERLQSLYKMNYICPPSERRDLSVFRSFLHEISAERYAEALAIAENLEIGERFLQNRIRFWSNFCREKLGQKTIAPENISLTFHELENAKRYGTAPWKLWLSRETTPIQKRSPDDAVINEAIEITELMLAAEMTESAYTFLNRWNVSFVQRQHHELQIYVAYLFNRVDLYLKQFQILNPLLGQHPDRITKSLLEMQFPLLHVDSIQTNKPIMDSLLVLSLIRQESAFNKNARSSRGATGLMQLMPSTARMLKKGTTLNHLRNPDRNIELGTKYLDRLMQNFSGDVVKVLAAYNAGSLRSREWEKRYLTTEPLLFADLLPFQETRDYVALIYRNFEVYNALTEHNKAIAKSDD